MDIASSLSELSIGRRIDGSPWRVQVMEYSGTKAGPCTALVGGVLGDKALGCLAIHQLGKLLLENQVSGTVILIPALNLPALAEATKVGSDSQNLNRTFPGRPRGTLTEQFAHSTFEFLMDKAECIVDLHSGTPTMGLGYTYSYGNDELAAAFGHIPVITNHFYDGQLSREASRRGVQSILPEHGGGRVADPSLLVSGCLNVLRYRGHLNGQVTGPSSVPLIDHRDLQMFVPSVSGLLVSDVGTGNIGRRIHPGPFAHVLDPSTGAELETFEVEGSDGLLLLSVTSPTLTKAGTLSFMVGYPKGEISVPGALG